jgi:hypothetical protein
LFNAKVIILAKASEGTPTARRSRQSDGDRPKGRLLAKKPLQFDADSVVSQARVEAVMQAARQSGLLGEKEGRIGGRVSPLLVEQAKRQTGIHTDTDLIEFALATVALEDQFAKTFIESRGKIDPELKLGF